MITEMFPPNRNEKHSGTADYTKCLFSKRTIASGKKESSTTSDKNKLKAADNKRPVVKRHIPSPKDFANDSDNSTSFSSSSSYAIRTRRQFRDKDLKAKKDYEVFVERAEACMFLPTSAFDGESEDSTCFFDKQEGDYSPSVMIGENVEKNVWERSDKEKIKPLPPSAKKLS